MSAYSTWTADDAAGFIAVPRASDDKYSRGVLGIVTGSDDYPGAAVLGVDAALHTGVGMVRYLGPARPAGLVLARRPEAVTAAGRVQAWLLGSGMTAEHRDDETASALSRALATGHPAVLDAGALELVSSATGPVVVTPHYGELARLLHTDLAEVAAEPGTWALRAADSLGVTVLLKGHLTHIAGPGGSFAVEAPTTWLATAGTGDALGGILGALVATHAGEIAADIGVLARLAATASVIHGLAAEYASGGGAVTVLELCAAVPAVVADLLRRKAG